MKKKVWIRLNRIREGDGLEKRSLLKKKPEKIYESMGIDGGRKGVEKEDLGAKESRKYRRDNRTFQLKGTKLWAN